jgi:hypothetical protein
MKLRNTILMAAFGLTMSALSVSAQVVTPSATIKISSLPFTVTTPGTYVLTGNLTCTTPGAVISIPATLPGPVVVNLKGFTISGTSDLINGICIGADGASSPINTVPNAFPITVRNGAIKVVSYGIDASGSPAPLQNLLIADLDLAGGLACITFSNVQNSVVRNCTFETSYGIVDQYSPGGNHYSNLSLHMLPEGLWIVNGPTTLEDCQFAPPAAQ